MATPLQAPPRQIPWPVKFGLIFGQGQTMPAGIFATIFLVLVWFFALQPIQTDLKFSGKTSVEQGELMLTTKITSDRSQSGFKRSSSIPVFACHFNFQYQGRTIQAISYFSSSQAPLQNTKVVPVEFLEGQPELARINLPGYRYTLLDPWALTSSWIGWPVLLLPVLCYLLWIALMLRGAKLLSLLKNGKIAKARLLMNQKMSITTKNNAGELVKLHRLVFAYDVAGKIHEIELKTSDIDTITDEKREDVIYLPSNPKQARLVDTLPDWIVREDGSFHSTKLIQNYIEFAIPVLMLLGIVILLTR